MRPVAGAVACALAVLPLTVLDTPAAGVYALLASTLLAFVGAATCGKVAVTTTGRSRRGWALLSTACLGWGSGNAYWTWNELVAHATVLFPSPADTGFLIFPTAAGAGLWLISGGLSLNSRLASLLDGLIVTGSLFVVSWVATVRSVYEAGADSLLGLLVSLAYPLGDIVLVTMAFLLAARARRGGRRVVALIIVGLLAMATADTLFAVATAAGTYASGSLSDAGWVLGFASIAGAGYQVRRQQIILDQAETIGHWQVLLPYVPFGMATTVSATSIFRGGSLDTLQTGVLVAVVVLILARQFLTIAHNSVLTRQLRHQATHDPLTGLGNRTLINEKLQDALERPDGGPAIFYLDLDDFKLINDGLGHDAGDALLCGVADRLSSTAGTGDTVGRLGGDEFAVLARNCPDPAARAHEMLTAMRRPFDIAGGPLVVTASIGVAAASDTRTQPEALRKHVDLAMHAAKERGKDTYVVFEPAMRDAFDREMTLRAELTRALEAGALHVAYQPIVDLADGRTLGVEALARWRHPSIGDVSPADFIGVAERAGLIAGIGMFVLDRACGDFVAGIAADYLSVNVSRLQLLDPTLPQRVAETLHRHGMHGGQLVLEVTESALADEAVVIDALHRLRRGGVRIAIDDFGTGYSSLRALRSFPADIIKIDRSYVQDVSRDSDAAGMLASLSQLFGNLGLTTIVEGIEDADQARTLIRLGYQTGQGFLYSRPVPATDLHVVGRAGRPVTDLSRSAS